MTTDAPEPFLPIEAATPTTPWRALGWLLFAVALCCAPVVVWSVWGRLA